ncbi:MAG: hypothetical protein ACUVQ1_08545 [Candidatus Kapaibacteriales bacterium]
MGTKYFLLGLAFALVLCIIFWNNFAPMEEPLTKTILRIDTMIKISPSETIKIKRTKVKIKYVRDTLILEKPFVASFDTILLPIAFRQNIFSQ